MRSVYSKYLLPGLVFQSIVIGGGYGTGRELVEFFLIRGPLAGYLGMLVATLIWGVVLALGFELARAGKHYDYRTFTRALLGRGWVAFEVLMVLSIILTTAVVGSASGELLNEAFGWPHLAGVSLMVCIVALLAYRGSGTVEKFFALWSMVLYGFYLTLIVLVLRSHAGDIERAVAAPGGDSRWLFGGMQYAAYNLAALPAMLFVVRHIESRLEAVIAGFAAGAIAMFPGALIYTTLLAFYPQILDVSIPAVSVLNSVDVPIFQVGFQIVLFGTFIETGTGMIHGFNERVAGVMAEQGRQMSPALRLYVAAAVLVTAVWLADRFGLVALISQGYGLITWGFWALFLLPVIAIGSWRMLRDRSAH